MIDYILLNLLLYFIFVMFYIAGKFNKKKVKTFEVESPVLEEGFRVIFKVEDVHMVRLTGNKVDYFLEVYFYDKPNNITTFKSASHALDAYNKLTKLMESK